MRKPTLPRARRVTPSWWLFLILAVIVAYGTIWSQFITQPDLEQTKTNTTTALAQEQAHAVVNGLSTVAPPAKSIADGKATPPPTNKVPTAAPGSPGSPGAPGAPGRGIASSRITGSGDLVLTYSDHTTRDVGHVVGPSGKTGATGSPGPSGHSGKSGRGVLSTSIQSGHLMVTYTDNTSADLGAVVGRNGVSVSAAAIANGHLVIALSDGSYQDVGQVVGADGVPGKTGTSVTGTKVNDSGHLIVTLTDADGTATQVDAGPVVGPQGPAGPTGATGPSGSPGPSGAAGEPPVSWTQQNSDGSISTCTRVQDFDPDNPRYSCVITKPAPTPATIPTGDTP